MEPEDVPLIGSSGDEVEFEEAPKRTPSRRVPLEKQISRGEEILVQVAKDPLGTKGARVTSHVSLPGRYMVFMPGTHHIGISRRIEGEEERKRLREIAQALKTDQGGFILRTACEGLSKREIQRDLSFLTKLWDRIQKKSAAAAAPSLIHQDLDLIMSGLTRPAPRLSTTPSIASLATMPKLRERFIACLSAAFLCRGTWCSSMLA